MPWKTIGLVCAVIVAGGALAIWLLGRPLICTCGSVKFWHGATFSSENSQHIADWYTFTHGTHGLLFYFLLWLSCRATGLAFRAAPMLIAAVAIETAWEVIENTNFVIDRFRQATIALDYYGDSVINSVADVAAMVIGFVVAMLLPVWGSVVVVAALEGALAYFIRDNLMLNIFMLLYPVEAIRNWQKI